MKIKFFYKYRPIYNDIQFEFIKEILIDYKLYLSDISYFTDPFDSFQKNVLLHNKKKILSLTTANDNKLLWAYYAGWYSGIMIEFRINLNYDLFNGLKKIRYIKNDQTLINHINNKNLYTKPIEFAYEKEWRLVYEGEKKYLPIPKTFISSVTLGPALDIKYKQKIQEICLLNKIKVLEYISLKDVPIILEDRSKKAIVRDH